MSSPMYNNHYTHDELYDNSAFSADISNRMQVPKSIRVGGGNDGSTSPGVYNPRLSGGKADLKYEMKVPERILVVGQDQHVGMKAPPHELVLENSILSMDKVPPVRVQTPPRSITVDTLLTNGHDHEGIESNEESDEELEVEMHTKEVVLVSDARSNNSSFLAEPPQLTLSGSQLTEEVFVLRQQIGRLHRRMAGFEREQQQRQQRDALIVSIGAVYMVWKVILWLTRSS